MGFNEISELEVSLGERNLKQSLSCEALILRACLPAACLQVWA